MQFYVIFDRIAFLSQNHGGFHRKNVQSVFEMFSFFDMLYSFIIVSFEAKKPQKNDFLQ
jgi:hypothetical protein